MIQNLNFEYIFYRIFLFLRSIGLVDMVDGRVIVTGDQYLFYLKLVLIFISVFSTFLIIDFLHRLILVRREETALQLEKILKNLPSEEKKDQRWGGILELLGSSNESDWKLAIIEADKMLDNLLVAIGYQGESLGDRLMAVEKGDMQSLDDAWEAHKYRNKIAHEDGFQVSQHEAKRVIGLYSKVFSEYRYI